MSFKNNKSACIHSGVNTVFYCSYSYVQVPVGPDIIVWNLHRRYGVIRLPMVLQGWKIKDIFGWDEAKLTAEASYRRSYEPVMVLTPRSDTDSTAIKGSVHANMIISSGATRKTKSEL